MAPNGRMEPYSFIAEYYRRGFTRFPEEFGLFDAPWDQVSKDASVIHLTKAYRDILPRDKSAKILDIGFGYGGFIAACIALGYTNIEGADFGVAGRSGIRNWSTSVRALHDITEDIGGFLEKFPDTYDFIHLSHVIEHIPKYSLFYNVDGIYRALKTGGTLLVRTPNMEGPLPASHRYVALTHEFGFSGLMLQYLLELCNFEDVKFITPGRGPMSLRQQAVSVVRWLVIAKNRLKHRMFGGWNLGGQYSEELVVSARRLNRPPLFDPSTR